MSFDINGVAIQKLTSPLSISFTGNNVTEVNYALNFGSLVTQSGKLTGDDQNNDGYIQRGETVDHDNPGGARPTLFDPIPDLKDAQVLGIGKMGAFVLNKWVEYPVILVQQGNTQYLLYPGGGPGPLTSLLGTVNTKITFFPNGKIGPGGRFEPCFARGTMIVTERGEVAVEDLVEGDLVQTADNGLQPIRWIGGSLVTADTLADNPKLRPIRIRQGALGDGVPARDLVVSPQHRILVRSQIAQNMFGAREVLVAAKQLCQLDGIDVADDLPEVQYFHILFDRHEVILSNGAETEALFTGDEALRGVGPAALEEILAIFPQLRDPAYSAEPARMILSGRSARSLAVRHARNGRQIVQ